MKTKKSILLLEDDIVDQSSVVRAFKELNVGNELLIAANGEKALEILRSLQEKNVGFMLVDLNMPRMNGLEFIREVKKDEKLNHIPIVVLTTSNEEKDRMEVFKNSVAGYLVKPVEYSDFVELLKVVINYWTISEFPDD